MAKTATIDIHIDEYPGVHELRTTLHEAEAELRASEEELDHLGNILNPLPWTSTHTPACNELDVLRARQQEPFARERYLVAKAAVLESKPRYEQARSEALRQFTDARNRARLPNLRRFSAALDEAARIGAEIRIYDQETARLGGSDPGHPFAQLLDDPPYRQGDATRVRNLVNELGVAS